MSEEKNYSETDKPENNLGSMCTPWAIARSIGIDPYPWQTAVLADIVPIGSRTALKAANGSGKTTSIVSSAVIWHATAFEKSTTVLTSGAWRQVRDQLFPAIQRHKGSLPGWEINASDFTAPNGSRCIGFSTDDPGKFEGWHADDHTKSPLLIIVDEAKSVKPEIFQAKSRCQPTRELLISSPGGSIGPFYDSFHKLSHLYNTHTVTSYDCPHISKEWINEQIEEYGIDHPLVRSMIFAEFMDMGEDGTVIPLSVLERCLSTPIHPNTDFDVHAFCDFAAGGDENVLALRRGNVCKIIKAWRETNTMSGCGEFISLFNKLKLRPEYISGDAGGMGKVWCDRFDELGWNINRVDFGAKPNNKALYFNRIAEIWGEGARMIENKEHILPQDDDILKQQLVSRKWDKYFSDGRLKLVSKDAMKKDGLHSPDRAEALLGCMSLAPNQQFVSLNQQRDKFWDEDDFYNKNQSNHESDIDNMGMNVGY